MDKLEQLERDGKAFVIRPQISSISHFENDMEKINSFYQHGYDVMSANIDKLKDFMDF